VELPADIAKGEVSQRSSGGVDGLATSDKGEEKREGSFGRVPPQGKTVSIAALKPKISLSS
jgi:hypothetical protein